MQRKCLICPPSVGALVLPVIYRAIKTHYPQLLLRNPPISGAENQLSQFQTDLITDNMFCTGPYMLSVMHFEKVLLQPDHSAER